MDKKFIDGFFCNEKTSQYGNFMTVSILIPKFAGFVKKFKEENKEQKYININIFPVKEPKEKGNTHYAVLNEYKKETFADEVINATPINSQELLNLKKKEVPPPPLNDDMPF